MKKYTIGQAMMMAMTTNFKKSFASKPVMPATDAPNIFRMAISLVRVCTTNIAQRPAGYVEQRKSFVLEQVAQGKADVVLNHSNDSWKKEQG